MKPKWYPVGEKVATGPGQKMGLWDGTKWTNLPPASKKTTYATLLDRIVYSIFDLIVYAAVGVVLTMIVSLVYTEFLPDRERPVLFPNTETAGDTVTTWQGLFATDIATSAILSLAYYFVYIALSLFFWGGTPGQRIMKYTVVDQDGRSVKGRPLIAILRTFVFTILQFMPITAIADLLWAGGDRDKQTIHDKSVNVFVVRETGVTPLPETNPPLPDLG